MEIERKYLLRKLPADLNSYPHYDIEQAYITTAPVIRVRKKSIYEIGSDTPFEDQYVLTVKSGGMMTRQEYEMDIDAEAYQKLVAKADGNLISKTRYKLPLDQGLTLELDIFHGLFDGLVMGEIEFPDQEMANSYPLPVFAAEDVTYDTRFHNSTMSSMDELQIIHFLKSINN